MTNSYAVITQLFSIFTMVAEWFGETLELVGGFFYDTTNNTFTWLGALTLVALGISVICLLIGIVRAFIRFR